MCADDGQCVAISECVPTCLGKTCGSDGCGGSCGACQEGLNCVLGSCVEGCLDPVGCAGLECGYDACGNPCGACELGVPCGLGGMCNTCVLCNEESACLDLGLEDTGLLGWQLDGDARVVQNLGATLPQDGLNMLQISTGLDLTTEVGVATFGNCLPSGNWTLSFDYKFYSEEFKEWCGANVSDAFVVELFPGVDAPLMDYVGAIGFEVSVDDLCAPGDYSCGPDECGSQFAGLEISDVGFDKGGVYNTPWISVAVSVSELIPSGEPFTLRFKVSDASDSLYDTAVLIDKIELSTCTPSCDGKTCGGDGCGGSCGSCLDGELCAGGTCCTADCGENTCGPNGCGGICGLCDYDEQCVSLSELAVEPLGCTPDPCHDKECGSFVGGIVCGVCTDPEAVCYSGQCCVPDCDGKTCGYGGCNTYCGFCGADEVCADGTCCVPSCEGVQCGDGGCAGTDGCGSCPKDSEVCVEGACVCIPDCEGKQCGPDGCGGTCGACPDTDVCSGGSCCSPDCEGTACGPDSCGGLCGDCQAGSYCDEGACIDGSCGDLECGPNGAGLSCGGCGTFPNVCVGNTCTCPPQCAGKECGPDACGGSCGTCDNQTVCVEGSCCTPDCTDKSCGEDGCGGLCGACWDGLACTSDSCQAGTCVYEELEDPLCCEDSGVCEDGDPCTSSGLCVDSQCVFEPLPGCCVGDADCQDGDDCTINTCDGAPNAVTGTCVEVPGCCLQEGDCDDEDPCTTDSCDLLTGTCSYDVVQACCSNVKDCDDGVACTIDACTPLGCTHTDNCCTISEDCDDGDDVCTTETCVDGACVIEIDDDLGCCEPEPFVEDFENGVGQWWFQDGPGGCQWQLSSSQAFSPTLSLYYGNPATGNFACGVSTTSVQSGVIALHEGAGSSLTAAIYMGTESSSLYDQLFLDIVGPDASHTVWVKPSVDVNLWFEISVNLNAWAGQNISLRWRFDTVDAVANSGKGVFIDDIMITSTCEEVPCGSVADCDDGLQVSTEKCTDGFCKYSL